MRFESGKAQWQKSGLEVMKVHAFSCQMTRGTSDVVNDVTQEFTTS